MIVPIIIINWNGIEDTMECIQSVLNTDGVTFHIHLIDNNSANSEGEKLQNQYQDNKNITVYLNDSNLGFAKAHIKIWEEILAHGAYKYIALLNNDTTVDPNWLNAMTTHALDSSSHIVSVSLINYYDRNTLDNIGHRMLNTGEIIPIGHREEPSKYRTPLSTIGACGGAMLIDTDVLESIGFFDPYFSTGYEDAEFGLRSNLTGFTSSYTPDAKVYHKIGQSINKIYNEEYSLMIHTSILYSYFKCMPLLNIILAIPSFIFKYISMIIIDIIFLRPKFLRILFKSWWRIIKNEGQWLQKRRLLTKKRPLYFKHPQFIFFLWFDIYRFWKFIILKKESSVDRYGT